MNHASDLLRFALVNLLVSVLNQMLICTALGRLRWSLWKWSGHFYIYKKRKKHL